MIHQLNILIHVLAGTLALIIGLVALVAPKHSYRHVRFGRCFLYLLAVVVGSGFMGWIFFRSNPFLLMLTLLSGYVGYAGWRSVRLREKKSSRFDLLVALFAITIGLLYLGHIRQADANWNPVVIYSTLGALCLVATYDILKYVWLYPYLKKWWIYEHIYKMVSAFSAIFSAFIGTVLPDYKPYSQIGPSSLCMLLIVILIWKQALAGKKRKGRHEIPFKKV